MSGYQFGPPRPAVNPPEKVMVTEPDPVAAHAAWREAGFRTLAIKLVLVTDAQGRAAKSVKLYGRSWEAASAGEPTEAVRRGYRDVAVLLDNAVQFDFDMRDGETDADVLVRLVGTATQRNLDGVQTRRVE